MIKTRQKTDIQIEQSGGMNIVRPLTKEGRDWVKAHLNFEQWQVIGESGVAVDHCTVDDLRQHAINDGLSVK